MHLPLGRINDIGGVAERLGGFRRRRRHGPDISRVTRHISLPRSGVTSTVGTGSHRIDVSTPVTSNRSDDVVSFLSNSSSGASERLTVRSLGTRIDHVLGLLASGRRGILETFFKVSNSPRVALSRVNRGCGLAERHMERVGRGTLHQLERGAGGGLLGSCLKRWTRGVDVRGGG